MRQGNIVSLKISLLANLIFFTLFIQCPDTFAQRSRPEPNRPAAVVKKGTESRSFDTQTSSKATIDELSRANEGLSESTDPASILGNKAVIGRVQRDDLTKLQYAARNIWESDFNKIRAKIATEMQFNQFLRPISPYEYQNRRGKNFDKIVPLGLEKILSDEAKNGKGYFIFTSVEGGGSLVSYLNGQYGSQSYTYIDARELARATLYFPYMFDSKSEVTFQGKNNFPILAIDSEMFFFENKGVVQYREFLFPINVDIRSFDSSETNPIKLRSLESRQLEFEPGHAEPATIAKLLGCCVYVRPPAYSAQLVKFLESIHFEKDRLRIALMVHDSRTRSYLSSDPHLSAQGRSNAINRETKDIESWVISQLKKAKGGTLLLLSHVEGKDYVVRDSTGTEAGRISIQRANELALSHGVTLFNLGCKTADALHDHDGVGVYDSFNSIHMLRTISNALKSGHNTIASFLERLGTPEARIVIPASIMNDINSLAALRDLRDQTGKKISDGRWMRIPAIETIISPSGSKDGFPISMSVFMTSTRQNRRGSFPVIGELQIVMPACKVLAAAKKLKWEGSQKFSCEEFRSVRYVPTVTYLYGHPERKFR